MRNLKIHQQKERKLPAMGVLTHVTELTRYNYIYINHLLKLDDELGLKRDFQRTWDNDSLAVYYRGFKIGYLGHSISRVIHNQLKQHKEVEIRVKSLAQDFNRISNGLDILIKIL